MENFMASWRPQLLSILRIMAGLLILQYGMAKTSEISSRPDVREGRASSSLYGLAGILELVLGALVLIGLFTRFAAFVLAGEMAVAYFMGHAPRGLLSDPERGRPGNPVLLRLPLSLSGRCRPVERGRGGTQQA